MTICMVGFQEQGSALLANEEQLNSPKSSLVLVFFSDIEKLIALR